MNPKYELVILLSVVQIWVEDGYIDDKKLRKSFTAEEMIDVEKILDSIDSEAEQQAAIDETIVRIKQLINELKGEWI